MTTKTSSFGELPISAVLEMCDRKIQWIRQDRAHYLRKTLEKYRRVIRPPLWRRCLAVLLRAPELAAPNRLETDEEIKARLAQGHPWDCMDYSVAYLLHDETLKELRKLRIFCQTCLEKGQTKIFLSSENHEMLVIRKIQGLHGSED